VNTPELDTSALLERVANALGDCLAIGSLNGITGALSASIPRTEEWKTVLSQATAGSGSVFPGVRLAAVARLLNEISEGKSRTTQLERSSFTADGSRTVFQRCPWDESEVIFVVLPENGATATNFAILRRTLESVRRDVAIVRAWRVEARCLN